VVQRRSLRRPSLRVNQHETSRLRRSDRHGTLNLQVDMRAVHRRSRHDKSLSRSAGSSGRRPEWERTLTEATLAGEPRCPPIFDRPATVCSQSERGARNVKAKSSDHRCPAAGAPDGKTEPLMERSAAQFSNRSPARALREGPGREVRFGAGQDREELLVRLPDLRVRRELR